MSFGRAFHHLGPTVVIDLSATLVLVLGKMNRISLDDLKDRDSTAPKRGSVFIGLMTPDGAIWSRYQRAVLMR